MQYTTQTLFPDSIEFQNFRVSSPVEQRAIINPRRLEFGFLVSIMTTTPTSKGFALYLEQTPVSTSKTVP